MDIRRLQAHFAKIGASLKVEPVSTWGSAFTLDVRATRREEYFLLRVGPALAAEAEFIPLNVAPRLRHLLLMSVVPGDRPGKFLCGHDERHWFVAGVGAVSTVRDALDSLKPPTARQSQLAQGVPRSQWNRRHNAGYIRQGEWFFIPRPGFVPDPKRLLLSDEPIRRGRGKPHRVEWLYREGGDSVYVHDRFPNGLTPAAYGAFLQREPEAKHWPWRVMLRGMNVYAFGRVRHPDHKTVVLPFWHRVVMNAESGNANVAFLD
jgi:hypothetical protein